MYDDDKLLVRIKMLSPIARVPQKAHPTDAGFDLVAVSVEETPDHCLTYGTGLAVEIPEGYVGLIFPRSSICKYDLAQTNAVGVVDSGYRGEVLVKFKPVLSVDDGDASCPTIFGRYGVGDRVGQLVILPYPEVEFRIAEELSDSDRGGDGHGSTGR